jgi:hypothetical protein
VISGRTGDVARMHRIMAEEGSDPEAWLPRFMDSSGR